MILKIRIILDTDKDVFRDIEIEDENHLVALHNTIKKAFYLEGDEMASFFLSNDQWFQGSEIPLENMSDEESPNEETMHNTTLKSVIPGKGGKMIYLYDFFAMWTFYCEVIDVYKKQSTQSYPNISYSYGERPSSPPEKAQMDFSIDEDLDNDFDDDFDEFSSEEDYFDDDPYNYY